ncbi:PP2C family protein-serine/threonine phosphatase [Streptomyces sp. NPDC057298]|uniref:PP2C family protein-serine/threonine phosphatase n=1 Tax=Streptomyces sp. NPDC057298 TaxID=3346091 RepID=UPI0036279445
MTMQREILKISSIGDAVHARTVLARLATDAGVPLLPRLHFLTALTARLRQCLDEGGAWALVLSTHPATDAGEDSLLRASVQPAARPLHDSPPWQLTLACPEPAQLQRVIPAGLDRTALAETVLALDDDTASALTRLKTEQRLVRLHREELHQTNQGVLALHAELDAAARVQQELLAAEQAARTATVKARGLLTFLADASAAASASLDREDILRQLPELLVPDYADHVDVWLFDDEETRNAERPAAAVAAARSGRPQHAAAHPGALPGVVDLPPSALAPARPLLSIPLTAHRPLGVLTLTAPGPRFDTDTCVMLVELARRIATALDHARRYEQHRDTAEALQRAQLTDLPTAEGLLLSARYLPATHGLNIGGDWYDAFHQPDGSLIAVIGDVTGHGLRAAIMMGQLRTALRAYAMEGDAPGQILTRLHRLLRHQQPDLYATAAVARFRPGDATVVWAAAGHPPPVLRRADGTVHILDAKPGIMLGVPAPHDYDDHTLRLPPGSTLALYTDGLVERRAAGIDPGIGRLVQTLGAMSTTHLEQNLDGCADSLLRLLLHGSERDDDVCLLLCHTIPANAPTDTVRQAARPSRSVVLPEQPGNSRHRDSVEATGGESGRRERR